MKRILMTSEEVLELAFASTERIREDLISDSKIETAQLQYLKPVLGVLYEKLCEPEYLEFVSGFLKQPLAYYVRSLVIGESVGSAGALGVLQHDTDYASVTSLKQQDRLRRQARRDADVLLGRAVAHMEANLKLFPDYDPEQNIRKKVSLKGGIIL